MTRRPVDLATEARRLRAVADEAAERLAHLEQRRLDAIEACAPAPGPNEIESARRYAEAAEAQAEAAARIAQKQEVA